MSIAFLPTGEIVVTYGVGSSPGVIGNWLSSGAASNGMGQFEISFEITGGYMGDMGSTGFAPHIWQSLVGGAGLTLQDSSNWTSASLIARIRWSDGTVMAAASFDLATSP